MLTDGERAVVVQGDCLERMKEMPDGCVQTCVTSPPYWGLRDYGVDGQLGLEETPELYVQHMAEVFREVRRVLRDDGTCWCNLGDSYWHKEGTSRASRSDNSGHDVGAWGARGDTGTSRVGIDAPGLKPKDLVGTPWRVAFALQADGWYLRSDCIWHKPNPMPESVTDRPTKSHEYVFLLTKKPKYYYDADAVREPNQNSGIWGAQGKHKYDQDNGQGKHGGSSAFKPMSKEQRDKYLTAGRNRRTVWTIPTHSFPGAHFATFPPKLVEPCILAGTSERGCCPECGAGWTRVVEAKGETTTEKRKRFGDSDKRGTGGKLVTQNLDYAGGHGNNYRERTTTGWRAACEHEHEPVPCIVFDPFTGAGTTGLVALQHDRHFIGIELKPEYADIARRRIAEEEARYPLLKEVES